MAGQLEANRYLNRRQDDDVMPNLEPQVRGESDGRAHRKEEIVDGQ